MGCHTNLFGEVRVRPKLSPQLKERLDHYHDQEHFDEPVGGYSRYCPWMPNEDGTALVWDGDELSGCYVEWLEYMIKVFLSPNGHRASGTVDWRGDDSYDRGRIYVRDNRVEAVPDTVTNTPPKWYMSAERKRAKRRL